MKCVAVLTRVFFTRNCMAGFVRRPKKVAVITRWPYYRGGCKDGFQCTSNRPLHVREIKPNIILLSLETMQLMLEFQERLWLTSKPRSLISETISKDESYICVQRLSFLGYPHTLTLPKSLYLYYEKRKTSVKTSNIFLFCLNFIFAKCHIVKESKSIIYHNCFHWLIEIPLWINRHPQIHTAAIEMLKI